MFWIYFLAWCCWSVARIFYFVGSFYWNLGVKELALVSYYFLNDLWWFSCLMLLIGCTNLLCGFILFKPWCERVGIGVLLSPKWLVMSCYAWYHCVLVWVELLLIIAFQKFTLLWMKDGHFECSTSNWRLVQSLGSLLRLLFTFFTWFLHFYLIGINKTFGSNNWPLQGFCTDIFELVFLLWETRQDIFSSGLQIHVFCNSKVASRCLVFFILSARQMTNVADLRPLVNYEVETCQAIVVSWCLH